ncbi:MAG: hypothetical protein JWM57_1000 [Phycisphaerales bacterium]|nr:hypothetical protein [Phycisphaerales bacterium]
MNAKDGANIARRVLRAAGRYERFFELSHTERTEWLLRHAFTLGRKAGRADARTLSLGAGDAGYRRSARPTRHE